MNSRFLIVEVLPDPLRHGHDRPLQLQHSQGDAVDVQNNVRTFIVHAGDRDFFRHREIVILDVLPVNQPDSVVLLTHVRTDLHAVAQKPIHLPIDIVERLAAAERLRLVEFVEDLADDLVVVPLAL